MIIAPPFASYALRGAPWTPADLLVGATAGWWSRMRSGVELVRNTQPTLVDGDMEAAGTAAWSAVRATLSKQSGSPSGTGSQVLRITATSNSPVAVQPGILLVGCTYRIRGWARGDGTIYPRVMFGSGGTAVWTGTASTTWQYFDVTGVCAVNGDLLLYGLGGGAPQWVEYDSITVENLSVTKIDATSDVGTLAGSTLVQATAAAMPWDSSGVNFDGTDDYMASDAAASAWPLHKAAGGAVSWKGTLSSVASGCIFDTCNLTTSDGAALYIAAGVAYMYTANGTTAVFNVSKAVGTGSHTLSASWSDASGCRLLLDGDAAATGSALAASSATDATYTLHVGRRALTASYYLNSVTSAMFLRAGALSPTELSRLHAWMVANA